MSGIAHCPSCSSTRTDAAGGCLSCGRKSVDQLPPTPTTDRDELVERLTERANIVASVQRYYVTGLGGMELEKDLRQAAARIQADAATIAGMREALTKIAEGDWSDKRWQAEHATRQIAREALKGGDHGIAAMGEGDVR